MTLPLWFKKDANFTGTKPIRELGLRFGPGGPLAIDHLLGVAKIQDEGGRVTMSYAGLVDGAFLKGEKQARAILERAALLKLIDLIVIDDGDGGFEIRFCDWGPWQEGSPGAQRQKRYRDKQKSVTANGSPVTPAVTPTVTDASRVTSSSREELREEERREPPKPPKGEPPGFEEWLTDHAKVTDSSTPRRGTKIRAEVAAMFAARGDEGYTLEQLKLATVGAYADQHRRENGYYDHISVLRPKMVLKLIDKGKRARPLKVVDRTAENLRDAEE